MGYSKHAVRDEPGMSVLEELQILAHHERVEELLVHDVEAADRTVLPRIVDEELQHRLAPGFGRRRQHLQVEMKLDRVGDTCKEGHSAAPADAGVVRAHVGIHRADVHDTLRRIGRRGQPGLHLIPDDGRLRSDELIGRRRDAQGTQPDRPHVPPTHGVTCRPLHSPVSKESAVRPCHPCSRAITLLAVPAVLLVLWWPFAIGASAHGFGSQITWNREVSRIVYAHCASCHRPGGTAFSLMTYADAQPRANEIKDAVLSRRMPPWGAVKGFGHFRNDQSLMQEQIELVTKWVDGGIRRGNNPRLLPKPPVFAAPAAAIVRVAGRPQGPGHAHAAARHHPGRRAAGAGSPRPLDADCRRAAGRLHRTAGVAAWLRQPISSSIPAETAAAAAGRDRDQRRAPGRRHFADSGHGVSSLERSSSGVSP